MKTKLLKLFSLRATMLALLLLGTIYGAWAQSDYSTDYNSNITLTADGTSASACKVVINNTEYDGIKAGTNKNAGAVKITIPSGTKHVHFHVAAWNDETVTLGITPSTGLSPASIVDLTSNSGISGNSPFTFSGDPSTDNYYKVITLPSTLTENKTYTFTATSGKRFVIWGVTAEEESNQGTGTATTTTINTSGITNTDVYTSTTAGSLSATVTAGEGAIDGATVTWSSSDEDVATVAADGTVTLVAAGSVTFTASYAGEEDVYQASSATYEMTVTSSAPSITVDNTEVNVLADDEESTIGISYSNLTISDMTDFDIQFCDAEGNNSSQPSWIEVEVAEDNGDYVVSYILDQNTSSEARSAYFKVYALGDADYVYSDLITVTQAGFVIDYAELPFEWEGGASATFTALTGVTASGLGSDYNATQHSPYLIKLDGTGDYIQVKTDGQPGVVSVDVKMIGGNTTSKIKVQQSADGTNFTDVEELTISGSQNDVVKLKTTYAFASSSRYVKLYFTKGSNVGVGPISIAKASTEPAIVAESSIALADNATSGEIEYSINNPNGNSLTATSSTDWISDITVTATKVTFTTTANTGAEREGKITLSYTGATDKVITVTQAEYVVELTYNLATSITSGKHYIITNGSGKAMGGQNTNNRTAVDVTNNNGSVTFLSDAGVAEFIIYGPDADDLYTIYDEKNNGYLYAAGNGNNYLKTQTGIDDNARWKITFGDEDVASIVAVNSENRNVMQYNSGSTIFSCYGSVSQTAVYLYEKDGEATPTESVTVTEAGYATFASDYALDFTGTGIEAYIANADGTTGVTFTQVNKVPAETGVLLHKEGGATVDVPALTGAADNVKDNVFFRGTDDPIESVVSSNEHYYHNYILNNGNRGLGFYKAANQTVAKNKAYITIQNDESTSVKGFIALPGFGDETAVSAVKAAAENGVIFNLAGQRVNKAQKGIFIVNGKKVVK